VVDRIAGGHLLPAACSETPFAPRRVGDSGAVPLGPREPRMHTVTLMPDRGRIHRMFLVSQRRDVADAADGVPVWRAAIR